MDKLAPKLIATIGDRDTVSGMLLAGTGDVNKKRKRNFLIITKDTTVHEIEESFNEFTTRNDIAIVLITQTAANEIRHLVNKYNKAIPAVLEIPSKECPYDPSKDSILCRAKAIFGGE